MIIETLTPDFRRNGKLQFITCYTPAGNPGCAHLTHDQLRTRLENKHKCRVELEDTGKEIRVKRVNLRLTQEAVTQALSV